MKLSKITLLLVSATMLTACSFSFEKHESHSEFYTHFETRDPISSSDVSSSQLTTSSATTTSSITSSSSATTTSSVAPTSSSVTTTSSTTPVADNELTVGFYNPSCGSLSKEVLDTKLAEYINQVAGTTFVSAIKNTSCQISNDIPSKGEKVLIIGASSSQGSLEFTFANTIKAITITAQTYHKPYVDYSTGETVPNVDSYSVLYVNNHSVDLKPTDNQPVEKEYTEAIDSKSLKLTNAVEDKSRVFIKSIKFVY